MQMTDEQKQDAYRQYADEHDMKPDDMSDEDKAKAESMYQDKMSESDDDMKSLIRPVREGVERLIQLMTPKSEKANSFSAFKSFGEYWYGEWTNNLKDREGEWFSKKAILDYVKRVDLGIVPLPDLWVWHEGNHVQIGTAKMINAVEKDGVVIVQAVGTYGDDKKSLAAKSFYNSTKEPQAMSHGFNFPEGALKANVYHQFNTFELSVLPPEAAANPYTSYEVIKGMKMTDKKRKYFEKVFGKDIAADLLGQAESKASSLAQLAEYKDFASASDLTDDDPAGNKAEGDEFDVKSLLAEFIGESAEIAEGQVKMAKAIVELRKDFKAQGDDIEALKAELSGKPKAASEAEETETQDDDLEAEAKKKESGEKSGFWDAFTTTEEA